MAKCELCCRDFLNFTALFSHKRWKHGPYLKNYECKDCGRSFRDSFILKRHIQTVHKENATFKVACAICKCFVGNNLAMKKHYHEKHDIAIESKTFSFTDHDKFNKWKEKIEKESKAKFVKFRGCRLLKDGTKITAFRCNRDGLFVSKGQNIRALKTLGPKKINSHCPAAIEVKERDTLIVKYILTHVGHSIDLEEVSDTEANFSSSPEKNTERSWTVISSRGKDICRDTPGLDGCDSTLRCSDCLLCTHKYQCICTDIEVKWSICEHIQVVCPNNQSDTDFCCKIEPIETVTLIGPQSMEEKSNVLLDKSEILSDEVQILKDDIFSTQLNLLSHKEEIILNVLVDNI